MGVGFYKNPAIIFNGEASATSVGTSGYTVVNEITGLPFGVYLVVANATFSAAGSGTMSLNVLDYVNDETSYRTVCSTRAPCEAGGGAIAVGIVYINSGGQHKIRARVAQSSGSAKTLAENTLIAVRLRGSLYAGTSGN